MKQTKAWLLSIVLCLAVLFGMALKTVAADDVVIPEEGYIYDEALNTYFMYTAKSWQSVVYETRTTGVAGNPATIKLMADLTVTDGTPENDSQNAARSSMRLLSGEVILDLNGCSLTLEKDTQNSYMRNRILIEENASLTISDSSDEKQGKISNNDEHMISSSGNLTINAGTFEVYEYEISNRVYSILYASSEAYTVINGGTFKSKNCITPQNSTLIINGGTFIGKANAVYLHGTGDHRIYGGSFTGGTADIFTAKKTGFLFVDPATGIGATFPGGLEVKKSAIMAGVVGECLADNMKFFVGDTQITSGLDTPSIAGDVVVKCLHGKYTDGICNYCNFKCPHKTMNNDTCTVCGFVCSHKNYENGFCTECSKYAAATLNSKGYYEIKNAGNLFWFADQVNSGGEAGRYLSAILLNDIDLENREWKPIGTTGGTTSQSFRGIFDGNGKTITGLYVESKHSGVGLFGEVRQGTVKDFTIYGEVKLIGKYNYTGGVIGSACGTANENGSTISGITSYVNVTLGEGSHGSNHVGGMIGYVNHSTVVENCVWYGTLDLNEYRAQDGVGGLIGKANAQFRGAIRNCAAYGTIETEYKNGSFSNGDGTPFDSIFIGGIISNCIKNSVTTIDGCIWAGTFVDKTDLGEKANLAAYGTFNGTITVKNCYYLKDSAPYVTTNEYQSDGIVKVTPAQLTSGEIAYKLGSAWGQEIGKDTYPVPGGAKVYYFDDNCGDLYTNTNKANSHFYEKGICTAIDGVEHYQPAVLNADGYYEIENAGQLYWFARFVNTKPNTASSKAILMADIDLEGRVWYPIGLYWDPSDANGTIIDKQFSGTFDGNGHTVSNFIAIGNGSQGLIGYTTPSVVVKNVGVIGATVSGWNAGAVLGYEGTVENCYAINCKVTAYTDYIYYQFGVYAGAVAGTANATVKDSYAVGCEIAAGEGMVEYARLAPVGGKTSVNCYYANTTATSGAFRESDGETSVSEEQLTSGEVAYLLGSAWGQEIGKDTYPVPGGAKVYYGYTSCGNSEMIYTNNVNAGEEKPEHSYVDGLCEVCETVCMHESFTDSVCNTCGKKVGISSASLALSDSIAINFKVKENQFTNGFTFSRIVFVTDDDTVEITDIPEAINGNFVFKFSNIAPHMMNDEVTATLYFNCNGTEYAAKSVTYSIRKYCDNMLSKANSSAELKKLLIDVLNYGAASQMYMDYKTTDLVNVHLTDEQLALGTPVSDIPKLVNKFSISNTSYSASWKSAGLNMDDGVKIRVAFTAEDLAECSYVKVTSADNSWIVNDISFNNSTQRYEIIFDSLNPAQMRDSFCFNVFDEEGNIISSSLTYSVESYAYSMCNKSTTSDELKNLLYALIKYGDSCKAFTDAQ